MKKKWSIIAILILVLLVGLVVPFRDQLRTLASLRKVDDYPLYVMTYYGDYGFSDLLGLDVQPESSQLPYRRQADPSWACTCFAALGGEGDRVFGRNFDWVNRPSLLLFTDPPNGYASVSMVDGAYLGLDSEEASWADRVALLDAPYWPFDGMNEMGLAAGIMAISRSRFDGDPQKVTIGSLHVIRLLLDYAGDVAEAIALMDDYNIDFGGGPPIHYLVADGAGSSAVIEYIDGEMRVLRNEEPWQVSTNFIISEEHPEGADSSCWRYNKACEALERAGGHISPGEAMAVLEGVSQSGTYYTMWSVVYGMSSGDIQVVVGREYDDVHEFNLQMPMER